MLNCKWMIIKLSRVLYHLDFLSNLLTSTLVAYQVTLRSLSCYTRNNKHQKIFLESDWLRAMQFLVNAVQKRGNILQKQRNNCKYLRD